MAGFKMEPDSGVQTRAPPLNEWVSPWPWHHAKHLRRQLSCAWEQFHQQGTSIPIPQVRNSGLGRLNNPIAWACVAHMWQRQVLNSGLSDSKAQVTSYTQLLLEIPLKRKSGWKHQLLCSPQKRERSTHWLSSQALMALGPVNSWSFVHCIVSTFRQKWQIFSWCFTN